MEIVAILATLLVAVLQIITISALKSTAKKVDELAAQKSNFSHNDRERSNRDFRQQQNNKRSAAEFKQKPQNQSATSSSSSVEQVEKSLRDINLKLKNAERDQENARKKIHTNFSKDSNFKKRDNRDGGSRGGRDNRRDRRSGNWQDRNNNRRDSGNNSGNSSDFKKSSERSVNSEKAHGAEENPMANQIGSKDAVITSPPTKAAIEPMDFANDDSLQHGRKVSVKRRMLKEEDSVIGSTDSENSGTAVSKEAGSSSGKSTENQQDVSADSEIKFGRR